MEFNEIFNNKYSFLGNSYSFIEINTIINKNLKVIDNEIDKVVALFDKEIKNFKIENENEYDDRTAFNLEMLEMTKESFEKRLENRLDFLEGISTNKNYTALVEQVENNTRRFPKEIKQLKDSLTEIVESNNDPIFKLEILKFNRYMINSMHKQVNLQRDFNDLLYNQYAAEDERV